MKPILVDLWSVAGFAVAVFFLGRWHGLYSALRILRSKR